MRCAWAIVCVLVPLAGCINPPGGGGSAIAGPPKLVINYGPDNLTEVYVHASTGEVNYTRLTLKVNNASPGEAGFHDSLESYALDVKIDATTFHANVTVRDDDRVFTWASLVVVNATRPASVTLVSSEGDRREAQIPFSTTLDLWRTEP